MLIFTSLREAQQRSPGILACLRHSCWLLQNWWRTGGLCWIVLALLICVWWHSGSGLLVYWHYWTGLLVSWQTDWNRPKESLLKRSTSTPCPIYHLFAPSFWQFSVWFHKPNAQYILPEERVVFVLYRCRFAGLQIHGYSSFFTHNLTDYLRICPVTGVVPLCCRAKLSASLPQPLAFYHFTELWKIAQR